MNLEEELNELQIQKDNPIKKEGYTEEYQADGSIGIFARVKSQKKEKKKKKKEKGNALTRKLDDILGDLPGRDGDGLDEEKDILEMAKEIKKATKKRRGRLEFDSDAFMGEEGKSRKKKKNLRKKYEEQYSNEKALLGALLKEANNDSANLKKVFDTLAPNGKVRGVSKTMTDLASTIVSANANRLQIIKALTDINTKITDFVLKEESRKKGEEDGGIDQEAIGAIALQSLFSKGNKEFQSQLQETSAMSEAEFTALQRQAQASSGMGMQTQPVQFAEREEPYIPADMQPSSQPVYDEFDQSMEEQINALNNEMKENTIYGRSDAGDRLIETENLGVRIKIRRWIDSDTGTSDFAFVAVDKYGNDVPDYEVPDKNDIRIKPIRFVDDTHTATDKLGRTYDVIDEGEI